MVSKLDNLTRPRPLEGQTALVTGASRGIGRGIALQLGEAGATVYITGRHPQAAYSASQPGLPSLEQTASEISHRGGEPIVVYCDHANTEDVKKLFAKIDAENQGTLDILVNNAFSGAPAVLNNAGKKFFECEPELWDQINDVGLRNHYICAVYAARMMVKKGSGLIVNVSSAGGLQYFFNVPYGVGKAALDRMSADMAVELKPLGVSVVSLWPGFAKTEITTQAINSDVVGKATGMSKELLESSWKRAETPDFVGKAVVALARDRNILKKSGKILMTADLASEYKFCDKNALMPSNMRSVRSALEFFGWTGLAKVVPAFVKIPKFALHFASYKF